VDLGGERPEGRAAEVEAPGRLLRRGKPIAVLVAVEKVGALER